MRRYLVRRPAQVMAEHPNWAVCCDGHELTRVAGRRHAIELASKVAQADSEEFGHETEVAIEGEAGSFFQYAIFGARPRLC
jgi:hypothetical protein